MLEKIRVLFEGGYFVVIISDRCHMSDFRMSENG